MAVTVDLTKMPNHDQLSGNFVAVTPTDDTAVTVAGKYPRKIFVGTGGDLVLYNSLGNPIIFKNVPNAWSETLIFTGVADTNNDASDIIAIG